MCECACACIHECEGEGHTLKPAALKCALAADCEMERDNSGHRQRLTQYIYPGVSSHCTMNSCLTYPLHPVGVVTWLPCQGLAPLLYTEREQAVFLLENRSRGGGIVARRDKGGRHE